VINEEEWKFLVKSSFSVYWTFENKWNKVVEPSRLKKICLELINDKEYRIVESAIYFLGETKSRDLTPIFIKIIESPSSSESIKERVIVQYYFNIVDKRIIDILRPIIQHNKSELLRKSAVYAFGRNISELAKTDKSIIDNEINILIEAINDSKTKVRKQVADVLSYFVISEKSVIPLISRLKIEVGVNSRKAMVSALGSLLRRGLDKEIILPTLKKISLDKKEDYRVIEEAKFQIRYYNDSSQRQ
jgi:HEAT repeat protein